MEESVISDENKSPKQQLYDEVIATNIKMENDKDQKIPDITQKQTHDYGNEVVDIEMNLDEKGTNESTMNVCDEATLTDLSDKVEHTVEDDSIVQTELRVEIRLEVEATLLSSLHLEKENFFKGCKWAPDGLCIMTNSDDNIIRLINTPPEILAKHWDSEKGYEMNTCLKLKEAETIYDYTWWPLMNSLYPATCCLATTARDQPIHLWDAFNGTLRATYIAKNQVDEVKAARCIGFSPDGQQMICGFNRELRLFYVDRPGDVCEIWPLKKHKCSSGQKGIISTTEFSPDASTIACGSYDGTAALYCSKNGNLMSIFNCGSGVTHIKYSPDGNRLYTGLRKSNTLICWDVRYLEGSLFQLKRMVDTNQRIYFDFASKSLCNSDLSSEDLIFSGGTDGNAFIWDVEKLLTHEGQSSYEGEVDPVFQFRPHRDCINGATVHPYLPVLATCSGQRHFANFSDSSEDESAEKEPEFEENSLKFWRIKI